MTHTLATKLSALLQRLHAGATAPGTPADSAPVASLASLNQARRPVRHPSTAAYRHRRPGTKPAWPFPSHGANDPGA